MWSNDPSDSLVVSNSTEAWAQKIIPSNDGGFYICWLSATDGYSLYMQRLDASGNIQWPVSSPSNDGILVYKRNLQSFYQYGASVDTLGNFIVGIDSGIYDETADAYSPGGQAVYCKVSPTGELILGDTGMVVSPEDEVVESVKIAPSSDGGAIISWNFNQSQSIRTVKVDSDDVMAWGAGKVTEPLKVTALLNDITPDSEGGVILSFVYTIPPFIEPGLSNVADRELLARKFDASGNDYWGTKIVNVYVPADGSHGLTDGVTVPAISDGDNGALYAIPAPNPDNLGISKVYIQQLLKTGGLKYSGNGSEVTDDNINSELLPVISLDAKTGSSYVMWYKQSPLTPDLVNEYSYSAQMIDSSGNKLWGELGVELEAPLSAAINARTIGIHSFDGSALAIWYALRTSDSTSDRLRTSMINDDGSLAWDDGTVDVKTNDSRVTQMPGSAVTSEGNMAAVAWIDGLTVVRAQNVNQDGSLGIET